LDLAHHGREVRAEISEWSDVLGRADARHGVRITCVRNSVHILPEQGKG
jgi:hypothetical protein